MKNFISDDRIFDIDALLCENKSSVSFERAYENVFDDGEIKIDLLEFSGKVTDICDFIRLSGRIRGHIKTSCARCLAPVEDIIELDVEYPVVLSPVDDSEVEYIVCQDKKINLYEVALEDIVANLPLKFLCREDCWGLCPKCGADLNVQSCNCSKKEIDPRLEGLADFFNK